MVMQAETEPLNMKWNTTVTTAVQLSGLSLCKLTLLYPSHNPHLHSLGLGMVTFHSYNGTFPVPAVYRSCTFQNHHVTFTTFDLRNDYSRNIVMNAVKQHFEEWWKWYNITLFLWNFFRDCTQWTMHQGNWYL
jgi:hypothetical protein